MPAAAVLARGLLKLPTLYSLPDASLQLLDLILVGHSYGGLIAHSLAQSLESMGFSVRGIVCLDTLNLPRSTDLPIAVIEPRGLFLQRTPYHWRLLSVEVNMMTLTAEALRL